MFRSKLTFAIALFTNVFLVDLAVADVIPKWNDAAPVDVFVSRGSSAVYEAGGRVEIGTLDAILVYDISGSMAFDASEVAPNGGSQRGDWAEAGAMAFVEALPDSARLGITQFKGNTNEVVPLGLLGESGSPHRTALNAAIDAMPRNGTDGTNIGNAIEFAANLLNDSAVNSGSKHLVVLTDGDQNRGDAVAAAAQAVIFGIDSVNTVGLPGANTTLLSDVAEAGNGSFVDGSDLSTLIEDFEEILDNAETLEKLEIFRESNLIGELTPDQNGGFSISLEVFEGVNLFTARATSSLGNVRESELTVRGIVAVPEPSFCPVFFGFLCTLVFRRNKAGYCPVSG